MEKLPPPFVQSLRFSSPTNQDILRFEDFSPYFQVDPEEDYSEHSLLKSATQQRTAVQTILSAASPTTTDPTSAAQILPVLTAYLDTLLNVFGLLHEQTLSSTSSSFSMSSLSASLNSSISTDPSTSTHKTPTPTPARH